MKLVRRRHAYARVPSDGLVIVDTRLSASVLVIILVVTHACVHIVVSMSFVPGLNVNATECI